MIRLKLTIDDPNSSPRRQILIEDYPFRIGRSLDNDLALPFGSISSHHLVIHCQDDTLFVTDQDSTNGTHHQGRRLAPCQRHRIALPTGLQLGNIALELQLASVNDVAFTMAQSSTRLRQMVDEVARQSSDDDTRPFFEVLSGPGSGHRYFLVPDAPETVLGTTTDADICLELRQLPKRLAVVTWEDSHCWLHAEDSAFKHNGTPLEGRHQLRNGDRFVIGVMELLFFDPLEEVLESMNSAQKPSDSEDQSLDRDTPSQTPTDQDTGPIVEAENTATVADGAETKPGALGAVELALLAMSAFFLVSTLVLLFVFLTASGTTP